MKNLSSWLIAFFMIMFWGFRVIVAVTGQMEVPFMVKPYDNLTEIILLFVILAFIPFVFKRKLWAAILYLGTYGWYFGRGLVTNTMALINGEGLGADIYLDMFIGLIAITLGVVAVFDMLFERAQMKNPVNKETDWFYKNKEYDRKLDDRVDKNNYRTL